MNHGNLFAFVFTLSDIYLIYAEFIQDKITNLLILIDMQKEDEQAKIIIWLLFKPVVFHLSILYILLPSLLLYSFPRKNVYLDISTTCSLLFIIYTKNFMCFLFCFCLFPFENWWKWCWFNWRKNKNSFKETEAPPMPTERT